MLAALLTVLSALLQQILAIKRLTANNLHAINVSSAWGCSNDTITPKSFHDLRASSPGLFHANYI